MKKIQHKMSNPEQMFYDFLNDFEITSMVKSIETQVPVKCLYRNRRVDFVLTLSNGNRIFLEIDGRMHQKQEIKNLDIDKDLHATGEGINTIRINFSEFFMEDRKILANKIEGIIDLLS